ncbi:unnamed protein product [Meganyctiphanes norvegica]|uniref:Uncharacterized protein n=1 Tax=Meganyctiphanes norvegica TaxID=48144 RepID=A0AAV2PJQ0_MEGNR
MVKLGHVLEGTVRFTVMQYISQTAKGPNGTRIDHRKNDHVHPPRFRPEDVRHLRMNVKREGLLLEHDSARQIVRVQTARIIPVDNELLYSNLPTQENLTAQLRYARKKNLPDSVKDLNFNLDSQQIPDGFLQGDIHTTGVDSTPGSRHIIFATTEQLKRMGEQKVWYIDATFKIVKAIHATVFNTCYHQFTCQYLIYK